MINRCFISHHLFHPSQLLISLLSTCLISTALMAQTPSLPTPSPIPPASPSQATSNLITNNPFVPKNNGSLNKAKNPTGPQSIANKSQVLQKYLQFKSIAIINKKNTSVFLISVPIRPFGFPRVKLLKIFV